VDEHALLDATRAAREAGLLVHDTYTPYAVHGMDEAMGLRPSRLTWVCFFAGLGGLLGGLALQIYTSAMSWPLDIGGKPFNSIPAFIPVTFELTVLCAALVTVAALFVRTRLYPGAEAGGPARVTDDRFALALMAGGARWSESRAARIAASHGAVETAFQETDR
jgi:hypothetical protein